MNRKSVRNFSRGVGYNRAWHITSLTRCVETGAGSPHT